MTTAVDIAAGERAIEVTETVEEPVIAKEQRVVEEVAIGKEAHERTQRVSDTVRRTEVEVEHAKEGRVLDSHTKCDTGYVRDRHGNEIQPPRS